VIFSPLNIGTSELLGRGRGMEAMAAKSRVEEGGFEVVEGEVFKGKAYFDIWCLEVGGVEVVVDMFEEVVFDV
jgi:hypothetical protein